MNQLTDPASQRIYQLLVASSPSPVGSSFAASMERMKLSLAGSDPARFLASAPDAAFAYLLDRQGTVEYRLLQADGKTILTHTLVLTAAQRLPQLNLQSFSAASKAVQDGLAELQSKGIEHFADKYSVLDAATGALVIVDPLIAASATSLAVQGFRNLMTATPPAPSVAAAAAPPRPQRLRGTSFTEEYRGPAAAAKRLPAPGAAATRTPSMNHEPGRFVLGEQDPADRQKIVLVLDLDETLVFARSGPLYARPGLEEFFDLCAGKCEVVVWTAGLRAYAQAIIRTIDKKGVIKHCIYRHAKWFTGQAGYRKDLAALGRSLEKAIIIENTPDCIRGYQQNGVLVEDYEGGEREDNTIHALTDLVRQLIDSKLSVPQFVTTSPMLVKSPVQTDLGDYIQAYTLNVGLWKPGEHTRVNRDLAPR